MNPLQPMYDWKENVVSLVCRSMIHFHLEVIFGHSRYVYNTVWFILC